MHAPGRSSGVLAEHAAALLLRRVSSGTARAHPAALARAAMSRPKQDVVDHACESWAQQWVDLYARLPHRASEYVGRVGSTLELIKILRDGAGAGSGYLQHFPEGFMGDGLLVACIAKTLADHHRSMLWQHYVARWFALREVPVKTHDGRRIFEHTRVETERRKRPDGTLGEPIELRVVDWSRPLTRIVIERRGRPMRQRMIAELLGMTSSEYHERRDRMKARIRAGLSFNPAETA